MHNFDLPDQTTSLPAPTFEFDLSSEALAVAVISSAPTEALHRLLRDQESQVGLLVARNIIGGFFDKTLTEPTVDAPTLISRILTARDDVAPRLHTLAKTGDGEVRDAVLRQRAPLALLGSCWLDTLSQPATQPAEIVNRLFAQHFQLLGEGNPQRGVHHLRRRALEQAGVYLPAIDAVDFFDQARTLQLTALHGLFQLSLSRLSASFLPETVGAHVAYHMLAVDDELLDSPHRLDSNELTEVLAEYNTAANDSEWRRTVAAAELVMALECEHVQMLEETANWYATLPLEAKVAEIIQRHAPYASSQHGELRVAGRKLSDLLNDHELDPGTLVRAMRDSRQLKPIRGGDGRFLRAIKFGGPMFGIFDNREATIFKAWAEAAASGTLPDVDLPVNQLGDAAASRWTKAIATSAPSDVRYVAAAPADDRALFHRLVNIESHGNTLPLAHERATENLNAAEMLFTFGAEGRYTDASWLDYTSQALLKRVDQIYWEKLVNPYRPLTQFPDRDAVVFGQKTTALGGLIDGAWAHRIGNVGRYHRLSDGMLASIYADEMGRGDVRKNHITLIVQVLHSMNIDMPHIRDTAFMDQDELPDLYGFAIHQLSLALFPDSFYPEILGYNLGIEMFGLGEMRLHETQKLKHYGFDSSYEEAHLSIDNFSAGHARQAAEIIVGYLDEVKRTVGIDAVTSEWRRIWRGYASFAYFVEVPLVQVKRSSTATIQMTV